MRKIIAVLPGTDERISHGSPTFWGGKKTFASFHDNHHGDGRIAMWCKSNFDTQSDLVEANPDAYFVPPYVGPSGWVPFRRARPRVTEIVVRHHPSPEVFDANSTNRPRCQRTRLDG